MRLYVKFFIRVFLFLLLFQFISPGFVVAESLEFSSRLISKDCFHKNNEALPISFVLKDKEELEDSDEIGDHNSKLFAFSLLDFTNHVFSLSEIHKRKITQRISKVCTPSKQPIFILIKEFLI